MSQADSQKVLDSWVQRIRDEEMPIFGHTVQQIVSVAEDDEAPAADLARVVLQDASMTARVLKLVNTIYYNPRKQGISTISRAVVVLGFDTVHNMCLSIALVDSFVHGDARDRLTRELARSIHAAVQARTIAIEQGDDSPEEVFIATLLLHLGELAFWCFSGETGNELDAVMRQPGYTPEQAQNEVLGFRLQKLTLSLAHEWRLHELLRKTIANPAAAGNRGRAVLLSHELAEKAEEHGWNAPQTAEVGQRIARLSGKKDHEMRSMLHQNAHEAARIAAVFGSTAAAKAIPIPNRYATEAKAITKEPEEELPRYPEPDGMLQLKILRELSMLLEKDGNFNLVMELTLEGIYRGVGMDRTLFALVSSDKRKLHAKYALGEQGEELTQRFHFSRNEGHNLFFESLAGSRCFWYEQKRTAELERLVTGNITGVIGRIPFYVCPIIINDLAVGVFYADRGLSGRNLDEEGFESFQHFTKQANMGLSLIASRRKR